MPWCARAGSTCVVSECARGGHSRVHGQGSGRLAALLCFIHGRAARGVVSTTQHTSTFTAPSRINNDAVTAPAGPFRGYCPARPHLAPWTPIKCNVRLTVGTWRAQQHRSSPGPKSGPAQSPIVIKQGGAASAHAQSLRAGRCASKSRGGGPRRGSQGWERGGARKRDACALSPRAARPRPASLDHQIGQAGTAAAV